MKGILGFVFYFVSLLMLSSSLWIKEMENDGMFEGDIGLDPKQMEAAQKGELVQYASKHSDHWPRIIYYDFAPELENEPSILAAFADYEKYTCLRFKRRKTQRDYMYFFRGAGCFSGLVGYYKHLGKHKISIGVLCRRKGIVIHEIAHMLGIYHEQSRPDRDNYVTIKNENVFADKRNNFRKEKSSEIDYYGTKYDYESIMHYSSTAFSKNGKATIITKDPAMQNVIGQREGFSKIDIIQINRMYKCDKEPTQAPPKPIGRYSIKHFGGKCLGVDSTNHLMFTQNCDTYFENINGGQLVLESGKGCVEISSSGYLVIKKSCTAKWEKANVPGTGMFAVRHKQFGKCMRSKIASFFPPEGQKLIIYGDCRHQVSRFKLIQQ